jgi:XPG I-region/XPG N-terminal domain
MGVTRLRTFVSNKCKDNGVYVYKTVKEFIDRIKTCKKCNNVYNTNNTVYRLASNTNEPIRLAVDLYPYCYKYKISKGLIIGFLDQIKKFACQNVKLVYVFDGRSPQDKKDTTDKRKKKKNVLNQDIATIEQRMKTMDLEQIKIYINNYIEELQKKDIVEYTKVIDYMSTHKDTWDYNILVGNLVNTKTAISINHSDITILKNLFSTIGVSYIEASGEADDTMVYLYKNGIVDACLTDDMDLLPKGCGDLVQINNKGEATHYVLKEILEYIKFTTNMMRDFCILMGSDYYSKFKPMLKPDELYRLFCIYPSIELFTQYYSTININILQHVDNYRNVRKYFDGDNMKTNVNTENVKKFKWSLFDADSFLSVSAKNYMTISDREKSLLEINIRKINRIS